MVRRWRCRHCGFLAWSDGRERLDRTIRSHLFDHHSGRLRKSDFRLRWECPYCGADGKRHDEEAAIEAFKRHLREHAADDVREDVHIADEIGRSGNVLVKAPIESAAADNARVHFVSGSDLAIVVTKNPKERLRLFDRHLEEWPERTIVVTTKRRPLEGPLDVDLSGVPVEIVELDRSLGPSELGETISRVIEVHYTPDRTVSIEFDVLYDIVKSFDLQTSYDFVSMLSSRLREVGAITHIYAAARPQLSTVLNVLDDEIDLTLDAERQVFTATA